ncbi:MAG TPA: aldo/keto reductase [Candidatus Limivivens merdigallinarum]|uniref:Aldo/keto reductase n=1 Tax=Candidatus Limivivens merdigallinarum TaxID=2840859 RepID=A0A9D1A035_9FIRM|nr:aldo/keto reductase [Candidatus Limivivens merdigallinarum]
MQYTKLGRTGMNVSRLCLGTMNFGVANDEKEAFRIMDAALDAGINFFDTANNYGFMIGKTGITEEIIGKWFAQGNGRRERTVLATKVHEDMFDPLDGPNTKPGLSAYKIRRHLNGSMKRLQTDHIELYYMHHIDRSCSFEELWDTFEGIVKNGLVDYIGASNFPAWKIAQAQEKASSRHFFGLAAQQERYSLLARSIESEVLPACREYGIGVVAWSPMGGGLLARSSEDSFRSRGNSEDFKRHQAQLEAYSKLCHEAGLRERDVALAFILSNPDLTAPIIGPRTLGQLEDSLKALEITLPEDMKKELDRIFPGPGIAPEAYAW